MPQGRLPAEESSQGRHFNRPSPPSQATASPEPQRATAPAPQSTEVRVRGARSTADPSECAPPTGPIGSLRPTLRTLGRSVQTLLRAARKRDVQSSPTQARIKAQRDQGGPRSTRPYTRFAREGAAPALMPSGPEAGAGTSSRSLQAGSGPHAERASGCRNCQHGVRKLEVPGTAPVKTSPDEGPAANTRNAPFVQPSPSMHAVGATMRGSGIDRIQGSTANPAPVFRCRPHRALVRSGLLAIRPPRKEMSRRFRHYPRSSVGGGPG